MLLRALIFIKPTVPLTANEGTATETVYTARIPVVYRFKRSRPPGRKTGCLLLFFMLRDSLLLRAADGRPYGGTCEQPLAAPAGIDYAIRCSRCKKRREEAMRYGTPAAKNVREGQYDIVLPLQKNVGAAIGRPLFDVRVGKQRESSGKAAVRCGGKAKDRAGAQWAPLQGWGSVGAPIGRPRFFSAPYPNHGQPPYASFTAVRTVVPPRRLCRCTAKPALRSSCI